VPLEPDAAEWGVSGVARLAAGRPGGLVVRRRLARAPETDAFRRAVAEQREKGRSRRSLFLVWFLTALGYTGVVPFELCHAPQLCVLFSFYRHRPQPVSNSFCITKPFNEFWQRNCSPRMDGNT
jgi:hypothetical protein